MTNAIFRYSAAMGKLVEQPTQRFGRPDYWNTESEAEHNAVEEAYHEYMSSLRSFYVAPGEWEEGRDYVEGKDFEVKFETFAGCLGPLASAVLLPAVEPNPTCSTQCDYPKCTLAGCVDRVFPEKSIHDHDGRLYTRADLIAAAEKAWEAGYQYGYDCAVSIDRGEYPDEVSREQYFKDTFNHDI